MLRRSLRLHEASYYRLDGRPSVSYRETLYRVFRKRKRHGHLMGLIGHSWSMDPHDDISVPSVFPHDDISVPSMDPREDSSTDNYDYVFLMSNGDDDDVAYDGTPVTQAHRTFKTTWSNLWRRIIGVLLLLLLLAFGLAHVSMEMRALRQEVQTLRQRADTFAPLADTIPNFALELMGLADVSTEMRALRQEVQTLRQRTDTFAPLADTIPNFALELMGLVDVSTEMRALWQEVQTLRQRTDTFAPLADTIPNFALESMGARVSDQLSSGTYRPAGQDGILNKLLNALSSSKTRRTVIQGLSSLKPGQCWCFPGSQGHLFVSLSHPISITHVTVGHITRSQSPYGHIASAPRVFSLYGMRSTCEEDTYLGTMTYDQEGAAFQTLELPKPNDAVFCHVRMEVESNWGNKDYTCLYSFRVHGKLQPQVHV